MTSDYETGPRDGGVFGPETTASLTAALDHVCRALNVNDIEGRQVVATRIIALARDGEFDRPRLCERILREANQAYVLG